MFLSIIIPTCHRNDALAECLQQLSPTVQSLSSDLYEIIVTDDGVLSTAEAMISNRFAWVRWVQGSGRGPAANRNNGAKHASGQWLVFTDDDCVPDVRWLHSLLKHITADCDVIEGKTVCPDRRDTPFLECVENLSGGNLWSCNMALRRELFHQINGFDELFLEAGGEDMEFAWRLQKIGARVIFAPDFLVFHPARRLTIKMLWWRTWMLRWTLLYQLRKGDCFPLSAALTDILPGLVVRQFENLLRTTWHLISKPDANGWRRQWGSQVWRIVSFPLVLPYLAVWEIRFRKMLIAEQTSLPSRNDIVETVASK